jgi:hypothetical protein
MASPHAAIQRIALATLLAARGEPVTYSAGSYSVELRAAKTRPAGSQVDAAEGFQIESRAWDWIVDPSELLDAGGEQLEPKAGHKITTADGAEYRVQPSDGSELAWRWSDGLHTWRRVHTEAK